MRIAAVLIAALAAAAPAAATTSLFETPSKNIVCGYYIGPGTPATLECGVASGLHPPAPKPATACKDIDPASNRLRLGATGKPYGFCSGDAGVLAEAGRANVLAYGKTWQKGPFRCISETTGLTCKNTADHGFFLSRQSWRSF
jgi:Family of unknown function (DUF6636)